MKNMLMLACCVFFVYCNDVSFGADNLINGAGATFPYPLYSKWFAEYEKINPQVKINYQSIGSGGGLRQFQERTVDFGASDAPMTDEQLAKNKQPVLHIPMTIGAVVLTYNLPGQKDRININAEVLADIFLGKITKWNDSRLQKINSNIKLPDRDILVIHRSDGSGTTNIFTEYLTKVSSDWQKKVGTGTAVNWPVGIGGKGNEGVSGLVKQTEGAIGYVELIYAESNKLSVMAVQNKIGSFVVPSAQSVTAAAAAVKEIPEDFRLSITNADGKDAYPLSSFTYILIGSTVNGEKGRALVNFLKWAIKDGQKYSEALAYAPLPGSLAKKVLAKLDTVKVQ